MERYITKQNLTRLAEDLAKTCRVLAPVSSCGSVTFRRFQPGMTMDLHSRMAAVSPKAATFPQTETLLVVKRDATEKKPELVETLPQGKSVVKSVGAEAAARVGLAGAVVDRSGGDS